MLPGFLDHRAIAGGVLAVLAAGVVVALVVPTDDGEGPAADVAALAVPSTGTPPTTAPPAGELDLSTHAPVGATLPAPDLEALDTASLRSDSTPMTGGLTDLIRAHFGHLTVEAVVIAQCESSFVPWAVGTNADGSEDHGLFQINDVHARAFTAVTGQDWEVGRYDPVANTIFARALYDARGWEAWTCSDRLDDPL